VYLVATRKKPRDEKVLFQNSMRWDKRRGGEKSAIATEGACRRRVSLPSPTNFPQVVAGGEDGTSKRGSASIEALLENGHKGERNLPSSSQ